MHMSRDKLHKRLKQKEVKVNSIECTRKDYQLKSGDIIEIRKFGKVQIKEVIKKKERFIVKYLTTSKK